MTEAPRHAPTGQPVEFDEATGRYVRPRGLTPAQVEESEARVAKLFADMAATDRVRAELGLD